MSITSEIRPGANRYLNHTGALAELPELLAPFKHPIIITGEKSFAAYRQFAPELDCPIYRYDGTASDEDAQRIADAAPDADCVLAIGGGRVLDTAKVTAELLAKPVITVPTLASNCAPYTPVGAIYQPNHQFKRVAYFTQAPYATVVDWDLILTTPHDYFVAGIGDTLAKWYELVGLTAGRDATLPVFTRVAKAIAQEILTTLQDYAPAALEALAADDATPAFTAVADTIIGVAGTTGGFGVADGRQAGAHAVHNGLTHIPETHDILHGSKVAYGVLVQLAYTGDAADLHAIMPFYQTVGLPTKLADLHITTDVPAKMQTIAAAAASPDESFTLIDSQVTPEAIVAAMEKIETGA
ncbi:iron-containing alcohol dehydrogenase family protein [Lacticaseibacillus baoqingensis]|uniref:Iron-containing alcohol dehydrogenase family protein n=1 Tax=Lacticaseibacillus baoqingensis TaxID=2486013 RepID=A0ABW4E982_9LACO|nr:iron-containing alcohol dehydrogenase family protein [Lacticaseibacillus baoqingensis]